MCLLWIWRFAISWWWPKPQYSSTTHSIVAMNWDTLAVRYLRLLDRCRASERPSQMLASPTTGRRERKRQREKEKLTTIHLFAYTTNSVSFHTVPDTMSYRIRWRGNWQCQKLCSWPCWFGATPFPGPYSRCLSFGDASCQVRSRRYACFTHSTNNSYLHYLSSTWRHRRGLLDSMLIRLSDWLIRHTAVCRGHLRLQLWHSNAADSLFLQSNCAACIQSWEGIEGTGNAQR